MKNKIKWYCYHYEELSVRQQWDELYDGPWKYENATEVYFDKHDKFIEAK